MVKYFKKKERAISLSKQKESIIKKYDNWHVSINKSFTRLTATGFLKPDIDSQFFKVKIVYNSKSFPKIFLKNHKFKRDSKGKLPLHLYRDMSLCVFYPDDHEWTPCKLISTTIIPWTLLWLFHYENWIKTEKWLGGGTVHNKKFKVVRVELPRKFVES